MPVRLGFTDTAGAEIAPRLAAIKHKADSPPASQEVMPIMLPTRNRQKPLMYDIEQYQLRENVKRFFDTVKHFGRIATRSEKLSRTFLAFIHLVAF